MFATVTSLPIYKYHPECGFRMAKYTLSESNLVGGILDLKHAREIQMINKYCEIKYTLMYHSLYFHDELLFQNEIIRIPILR